MLRLLVVVLANYCAGVCAGLTLSCHALGETPDGKTIFTRGMHGLPLCASSVWPKVVEDRLLVFDS